ncbi:LytR/AlgR family response regulator transcription factor [Galbibacter sp.]|uniref:LytR/AlgR family response regulator transcription factor n=1 Tax=Galbibacter sp. TaxID=2918471 RepID=UPI003A94D89A
MITALIIDDEKGSRKSLANLINKYCEDVQLIGKADGVESGITIVKKLRPELIFLDIRMRDGTGFQLLERLNERTFQVVFTTAYDEYAIRAFRFSAIDYLLKPINLEELQAAVSKAIINSKSLSQSELKPIIDRLLKFNHEDPTITVSTESSVEFIKVSDIVHLEASSSYTTLYMRSGLKVLSSKTLRVFEDLLSDFYFFRCHQSHLVSLPDVVRFLRRDGGQLEMKDGTLIPLSRRRHELFFKRQMK